jgi:phosphoribosylformylglycinamidine cyclo-ligase
VLPANTKAIIHTSRWPRPAIFQWLQQQGGVSEPEMWRTFNCGVGLVVCVAAEDAETAQALLRAAGETVWTLGQIAAHHSEPVVEFRS